MMGNDHQDKQGGGSPSTPHDGDGTRLFEVCNHPIFWLDNSDLGICILCDRTVRRAPREV